jgi:hypothetical protein
MQAFSEADAPVVIDVVGVQMRAREFGDMTITFSRLPRSTDLHSILRGLPDDRCPCPHWGYVISGRLRLHTATGEHDVEEGQAFYVEAGHAKEALEDTELFEVSPTVLARALSDHLQQRLAVTLGESD